MSGSAPNTNFGVNASLLLRVGVRSFRKFILAWREVQCSSLCEGMQGFLQRVQGSIPADSATKEQDEMSLTKGTSTQLDA